MFAGEIKEFKMVMESKEKNLCAHVLDKGKFVEKYLTELSKSIGEEGINYKDKIKEELTNVFLEKLVSLNYAIPVLETVQKLNKWLSGKKILVTQENGYIEYFDIENIFYDFEKGQYYVHHKSIGWNHRIENGIFVYSKHDFTPIEEIFDWSNGKLKSNCEETEEDLWAMKVFVSEKLLKNKKETSDILLEEDYVDLGLPSGLLWAKKNIGAATEEDAGLYFQWGDIQGYTAEQVGVDKQFGLTDYKWYNGSEYTKYNGTDCLTTLKSADDAATQIMGSDWRMPTNEEFIELVENTDVYFVSTDGVEIQATPSGSGGFEFSEADTMKGIKFYNKTNHSKYIFVPASGVAFDGSVQYAGVNSYLWSSSFGTSNVRIAWCLYIVAPVGNGYANTYVRYVGFGVRGVVNT